jgi:hypothetical protein
MSKLFTEYTTYNCTLDTVHSTLDKFGVAVIPGILSEKECIQYRTDIWKSVNHIYPEFNIEDQTTWKKFYNLLPLHSMLIQHYSIGHIQPVWDIRTHDNVVKVFKTLHKTDDLLISYDGISIGLPPEKTGRGWYRGNDWMHTDQSPLNPTWCIQGLVNLYPVLKNDSTLTICEGSHKYHQEFLKSIGKGDEKDDWIKLTPDEKALLVKKHKQFCVEAPIGSMILWDSRTFHQGIEPQPRVKENFRMVVYTCLRPKSQFDKRTLTKREKAFKELRLTNHWGTHLFPKSPRTYGSPIPVTNPVVAPVISDEKKKYLY